MNRRVEELSLDDYCQICLRPAYEYVGTSSVCVQCNDLKKAVDLLRSSDLPHYRPDVREFLARFTE